MSVNMKKTAIEEAVSIFLEDELGVEPEMIASRQPLFTSRILSSINAVRILQFLKSKFSIEQKRSGIKLSDLDDVDQIVSFILQSEVKEGA